MAVVVLFHALLNHAWLARSDLVVGCDVRHHLAGLAQLRFELLEMQRTGDWSGLSHILLHPMSVTWPRTAYLVGLLCSWLVGGDHSRLLWLNGLLWLTLCVSGTFLLGRQLYGRHVGALAAVLVSLVPGIYGLSRRFGLDLPATAMVPLCLWLAARMRPSAATRQYLVLGGVTGLALLLRPQTLFFLALPLTLHCCSAARARPAGGSRRGPWLVWPVALLVAAPFWANATGPIVQELVKHASGGVTPSVVHPDQPLLYGLFYLVVVWTHLSLPITAALGLAALRFQRREWRLALVNLLPGFLLYALLISSKWGRYLLPLAPVAMVLLAAVVLDRGRAVTWPRRGLAGALVSLALLALFLSGRDPARAGSLPAPLQQVRLLTRELRQVEWTYGGPPTHNNYLSAVRRLADQIRPGPRAPLTVGVAAAVGQGQNLLFASTVSYGVHTRWRAARVVTREWTLIGRRPRWIVVVEARRRPSLLSGPARRERGRRGRLARLLHRYRVVGRGVLPPEGLRLLLTRRPGH